MPNRQVAGAGPKKFGHRYSYTRSNQKIESSEAAIRGPFQFWSGFFFNRPARPGHPLSLFTSYISLSLRLIFFSLVFDLGLYDPHSPRARARAEAAADPMRPARLEKPHTMGTHVKTIGTQVYRIYGGRPRRKNHGVASPRPGSLSMNFRRRPPGQRRIVE